MKHTLSPYIITVTNTRTGEMTDKAIDLSVLRRGYPPARRYTSPHKPRVTPQPNYWQFVACLALLALAVDILTK